MLYGIALESITSLKLDRRCLVRMSSRIATAECGIKIEPHFVLFLAPLNPVSILTRTPVPA